MKKTLVAIAALAAVSAFAQSSVTISGTYNVAAQKTATGAKKTDLVDSNITFAATEDLGGGLKAFVSSQIQAGGRQDTTTVTTTTTAAPTVGNQNNTSGVWGRNASVGLSGGFGAVTVGRVESTNTTEKAIVAPIWLDKSFDRAHLLGAKSNYQATAYTLPQLVPGLTLGVSNSTLLNDKFAPIGTAANEQLSVAAVDVAYTNGPAAFYFTNKNVNSRATAKKGVNNEFAATYTLGAVKVGAAVTTYSGDYNTSSGTTAGNNTLLSASYAVTPAATVGFATVKRGDGNGITGAKGNAVAVEYALSKRTQLNTTVGKMSKDGDAANNFNQYRVGIKHAF